MPGLHYLEIVSPEVESSALYQALWKLDFGEAVADLGNARTAKRADGTLIGVRKPLADHEEPIIRHYMEVSDIEAAAKKAEQQGAMIAYPPTKQGDQGHFCILIHDGLQLGLWQA